jgi:hypothetical protein
MRVSENSGVIILENKNQLLSYKHAPSGAPVLGGEITRSFAFVDRAFWARIANVCSGFNWPTAGPELNTPNVSRQGHWCPRM